MSPFFKKYKRTDIAGLVRVRDGETKLGELIAVPADESLPEFLETSTASFVIVGIAEDIGVLANYGKPGTARTWNSFLHSFVNIQANDFTRADMPAVIGFFSFDSLKEEIETRSVVPEEKIIEYRRAVAVIDDAVTDLIRLIVSHKKIPVVVGGGHNNSYPLIKGIATAFESGDPGGSESINCINLDAHIDYRMQEGRHSGNGFRYAKQEGFLDKYFVLGLHENYLPENILNEVTHAGDIDMVTYEDIFIREKKTWPQALKDAVKFTRQRATGIELDLDSISNVPSSAATPCGVTVREALQYVDYLASHCNVAYLHICEGIASDGYDVGKLISFVVGQFAKSYNSAGKA